MHKLILTFISTCLSVLAFAQNAVKLKIYEKSDFMADSQFWSVCEGNDGVMYFGNNDGVLVFDGEHWQKIILPNNSSVRSLSQGMDGTIYAGGYNEAGIISRAKDGRYEYRSILKELQPEGRNLENIWGIEHLGNRVLFCAYSEIIVLTGRAATRLPSSTAFTYSAVVNNNYYVAESGHGILTLQPSSNTLLMAFPATGFNNEDVAEILPGGKQGALLVVTVQGGIYYGELATGKITLLNRCFPAGDGSVGAALKNPDGSIYIGTVNEGLISVNRMGQTNYNPDGFAPLKDGVVQKLYRTTDGNMWILQNNGLAYADYHSPYRQLFNRASVYDALPVKDSLYIATTQGIYYAADAGNNFTKVSNLQGQAWTVQKASGDIIACHDTGLYKIVHGSAVQIGAVSGFWKINPVAGKPGFYLASQYNGLYLLEKKGKEWLLHPKIAGFNESARDILPADEPHTYWVCHGYQGVFRLRINAAYNRVSSVDHFTNKNGLKNSFNVNVFRWQGKVVFTTNNGIYTFDNTTNRFVPYQKLNSLLDPTLNTRKILQYGSRTWFVQDDEAGYFDISQPVPEPRKDIFLNLKGTFNRGMECLVPLPGDKMLFGTTDGLFLYSIKNPGNPAGISTAITQVSYTRRQKQELLHTASGKGAIELPNKTDILRFDFAVPKMAKGTRIQYSYILEGSEQEWSPWQNQPFKEYTHLGPGTYTFKVKSRNTAGIVGGEAAYRFTVLPEWYQTTLAYILYGVLSLLVMYGIRLLIKRRIRYEKAKSAREAESSRRLLELEVAQLKLQRDKDAAIRDKAALEEDVINKSKELANYTMLLVQKKDVFAEITDDLKELKNYVRNEESRKKLLDIFQKLNRHRVGEEYMEVFDVHFEKVHHNFFEGLKALSPSLTQRELRLCAFVKMGLTNKEIAPLLGISLRGVENARYRIRKKLDVANEDNFAAFLEGVGSET
ncbi:triple tyrosine motif-containing protein [Flavobacterium sp. RHBU_24]|uniref:triple tyrosine motif-containing protein n=1 Tax=Flavobacterium sp. RHBU_24 TaxID=3391185 RepID=UPI003984FA38